MTKAQLIERYGLEWYEEYKARSNEYCKGRYHNELEYREAYKAKARIRNNARYHNNSEFREYVNTRHKARMKERYKNDIKFRDQHKVRHKARYVEDGRIDLINNYELALADDFKGWDIHHRMEIHNDYSNTSHDLIMMNLYYNRPPSELIWIRHSEHTQIHHKARRRNQCEYY